MIQLPSKNLILRMLAVYKTEERLERVVIVNTEEYSLTVG